jgi:hypothetical protein
MNFYGGNYSGLVFNLINAVSSYFNHATAMSTYGGMPANQSYVTKLTDNVSKHTLFDIWHG